VHQREKANMNAEERLHERAKRLKPGATEPVTIIELHEAAVAGKVRPLLPNINDVPKFIRRVSPQWGVRFDEIGENIWEMQRLQTSTPQESKLLSP
jgi:hypothetical protein